LSREMDRNVEVNLFSEWEDGTHAYDTRWF
jgi:hypothetical protein